MFQTNAPNSSNTIKKILHNYHFKKQKNNSIKSLYESNQQQQCCGYLPTIKQKISIPIQSVHNTINNPQIMISNSKRSKNNLKCICQMCICGQHKCPSKSISSTYQSTQIKYQPYQKNVIDITKSSEDMYSNYTTEQLKKQADKIMRNSPYNSFTTYRNTYKAPELNNEVYGGRDKGIETNRGKLKAPYLYNPKFHKFNASSIYQSDYTVDNLHSKFDSAPKKLQSIKTDSEYFYPKHYTHQYGRECQNLIRMKTQPNKGQGQNENVGQSQYKSQYRKQNIIRLNKIHQFQNWLTNDQKAGSEDFRKISERKSIKINL